MRWSLEVGVGVVCVMTSAAVAGPKPGPVTPPKAAKKAKAAKPSCPCTEWPEITRQQMRANAFTQRSFAEALARAGLKQTAPTSIELTPRDNASKLAAGTRTTIERDGRRISVILDAPLGDNLAFARDNSGVVHPVVRKPETTVTHVTACGGVGGLLLGDTPKFAYVADGETITVAYPAKRVEVDECAASAP